MPRRSAPLVSMTDTMTTEVKRGGGRPQKYGGETKVIAFGIPRDMLAYMDEACVALAAGEARRKRALRGAKAETGVVAPISRSEFIIRALRCYKAKLESAKKRKR